MEESCGIEEGIFLPTVARARRPHSHQYEKQLWKPSGTIPVAVRKDTEAMRQGGRIYIGMWFRDQLSTVVGKAREGGCGEEGRNSSELWLWGGWLSLEAKRGGRNQKLVGSDSISPTLQHSTSRLSPSHEGSAISQKVSASRAPNANIWASGIT